MSVSTPDRKLLWGRSGDQCAKCKRPLSTEQGGRSPVLLGEEAHVVSPKAAGPRFRPLPREEVDAYDNLILLCPEDHTLVDKAPDLYPETALRELKRRHEAQVRARGRPPTALRVRDPRAGEPLALRRVQGGGALMGLLNRSVAFSFHHPDPLSTEEAELLADFLGFVHDWAEIWVDVDAGQRVRVEFEASEWLHHLLDADLIVYAGMRDKVLEGGVAGPSPWPEAWVSIHRRDDPLIATSSPDHESSPASYGFAGC